MMVNRSRPASITYLAYIFVLLTFVSLGVFVASLASGSALAPVAGAAMVVFLIAAVVGFRVGATALARASEAIGSTHKLSIWTEPLQQSQIDAYRATYRGRRETSRAWSPIVVANAESTATIAPLVNEPADATHRMSA
jgi:hypothetical protein